MISRNMRWKFVFYIFYQDATHLYILNLLLGTTYLSVYKHLYNVHTNEKKKKHASQWARKFKKVQSKKNSWNQINQFPFLWFQKWKKTIFELGKCLKLPEVQFQENCFWFIWFHEFFYLDFFKFSGPLVAFKGGWYWKF